MKKIGDVILTLICNFIVNVIFFITCLCKLVTDKKFRDLTIRDYRWRIKDTISNIKRKIRNIRA